MSIRGRRILPGLALALATLTPAALRADNVGGPDPGPAGGVTLSETEAQAWLQDQSTFQAPADAAASVQANAIAPAAGARPDRAVAASTTADLIDLIAAGFELTDHDQRRVTAEYNWFLRHPDYMQRVLERSRRYMYYIVRELERRDMPLELALLPIVESAYDPFAYSHGRAAGLWQFIPATGKRYGMKQNWWYDGRRDVVAATQGALDYLEALYRKTDDWLLAVAAYNSGEGKVLRAMRRNRKAGKPTDFWHLKLPRETRAYVPKLLALRRLVLHAPELGMVLPRVPAAPYFDIVELDGQLDLGLAAELAGVSIDEIYLLNPGFNHWATDPQGPHRLLLPLAAGATFRAALAALPPEQHVSWQRYRIRSGDSLSVIAKRFGTTTASLRSANNLRGSSIRAGAYLLIPSASRDLSGYSLSAAQRQARRLGGGDDRYTVVVQPGDSFWELARKHGVGVRQLARWNGLAPGDTLKVGRQLVVRGGTGAPSVAAGPGQRTRRINYVVRRGDSLSRISSRFKVSVAQLLQWNALTETSYLQPGQRLVMFVDVSRQSDGG